MIQTTKFKNSKVEASSIEVADVLREHIDRYQQTYPLFPEQYKIVCDLLNCRTEYLGGHIQRCNHCGSERIMYNSCRNRHCPKCQNMPREQWLEARKAELLPIIYFHNVFTLPHDLNPIILYNKKVLTKIRQLHGLPKTDKVVEKSVEEMMLKLTGIDITLCPCCKKGKMQVVAEIPKYTGICANDIIRPPN